MKGDSTFVTEETYTKGTKGKKHKDEQLKSFNKHEADLKADAGTSPYIIEGTQALPAGTARSRVMITAVIRFFSKGFNGVCPFMYATDFSIEVVESHSWTTGGILPLESCHND